MIRRPPARGGSRRRAAARPAPGRDGLSPRPRRLMPWRRVAYRAIRPLLFRFDSEGIHRLSLDALRFAGSNSLGRAAAARAGGASLASERVEVAGLRFRSRVGIG